MVWKPLAAVTLLIATAPSAATPPKPAQEIQAPAAGANARYCLRVEAVTGTRLETVQCHTRGEWADWEVDVDKEWAKEGVRVIDG